MTKPPLRGRVLENTIRNTQKIAIPSIRSNKIVSRLGVTRRADQAGSAQGRVRLLSLTHLPSLSCSWIRQLVESWLRCSRRLKTGWLESQATGSGLQRPVDLSFVGYSLIPILGGLKTVREVIATLVLNQERKWKIAKGGI